MAAVAVMNVRNLTIALYATVAALMVILYVAGRLRRFGLVPLGDVVDVLRRSRAGQLALVLAWAWLGWHFLAR
jgi:Family of unknown function (DUF6186)